MIAEQGIPQSLDEWRESRGETEELASVLASHFNRGDPLAAANRARLLVSNLMAVLESHRPKHPGFSRQISLPLIMEELTRRMQ